MIEASSVAGSAMPHTDDWRIAYIPHQAAGGRGYVRAYGWGYLSWPGLLGVVAGAAGLAGGASTPWMLTLVFGGFVLAFAGALLNGLSERRRMPLVAARCIDVEIRHLPGIHLQRSAGWAVRAHMRYHFEDGDYESTPGRFGYELLGSRENARRFAEHLKNTPQILLHVDRGHPTRTLFRSLRLPQRGDQASR